METLRNETNDMMEIFPDIGLSWLHESRKNYRRILSGNRATIKS